MSGELEHRLAALKKDHAEVTGTGFETFYCPMLFSDEAVPLCKWHVIPTAFHDASRKWTVQRKDVDEFFGAHFESDFVLLQEKGQHSPVEILSDPRLAKKLRAKMTRDGERVEHFTPTGPSPNHFSPVLVEDGSKQVKLVLKLSPSDAMASLDSKWSVEVSKDLRLAALVSSLKAAHLTLFSMLGYRYALSAGGHFLGHTVLGQFFEACSSLGRAEVLDQALAHFREFVPMVRPMEKAPEGLQGTVADQRMYLCGPKGQPWGMMVLLRTGVHMQAVLVPVFESPDSVADFLNFLGSTEARFIEMRLVQYKGKQFEASPKSRSVWWPEPRFHEPLNEL